MECTICGSSVEVCPKGWDSMRADEAKLCCGAECQSILDRYSRVAPTTSSLSVDEEREALNKSSGAEAEGYRWRLASATATHLDNVRLRRSSLGVPQLVAARSISAGEEVMPRGPLESLEPTRSCTPSVIKLQSSLIACTSLNIGDPVTIYDANMIELLRGQSTTCGKHCICSHTHFCIFRALPCPLSSICHDGRCLFSNIRKRWECQSCWSYWSDAQFSSSTTAENRCRVAAVEAASHLYDSSGSCKPLTKAAFESLKRLLSTISDSGIGADHRLYAYMCQLFIDYFLQLAQTMRGAATQEFIAKMALMWAKLLVKSAAVQSSTWKYFGWYVGKIAASAIVYSLRFPVLRTDCIYLSKFVLESGFAQVFGRAKGTKEFEMLSDILLATRNSKLAQTFAVCEQWLSSFSDEPSDLQRAWEDYLLSLTSRAMDRNQFTLEHLRRGATKH